MRLFPVITSFLMTTCVAVPLAIVMVSPSAAQENTITYSRLLDAIAQDAKPAQFDVAVKLSATTECKVGESCPVSVALSNEVATTATGPFYVAFTTTAQGRLKFVQPETWNCEGENTSWLCKSPTQNISQSVQSRFTGQFALPLSATPQSVKICAKLVWLGNPSPEYTNARVQALQSTLKSQNIVMSAVDGISTAFLNRELKQFADKYGITGENSTKFIAATLFGTGASISSDAGLSNDTSCTTVNYTAPIALTPPKPAADFSAALAASAAVGTGLNSLAPNFGTAPVVTKKLEVKAVAAPATPAKAAAVKPATKTAEVKVAAAPAKPTEVAKPAAATSTVAANAASSKKNSPIPQNPASLNLNPPLKLNNALAAGTNGLKNPSTSQRDKNLSTILVAQEPQELPEVQMASLDRPVYTYAQRAIAGFSVYDIKSDTVQVNEIKTSNYQNVNVIRFTKLPDFGDGTPGAVQANTTSNAAKIIRGNQKPMPFFGQPGVDFSESFVQGADPKESYRIITPNPNSPAVNQFNRLPVPFYPNAVNGPSTGGGAVIKDVK